MTNQEAFEILRDTPIDIRSTREDDIHTLYATAQLIALDSIEKIIKIENEFRCMDMHSFDCTGDNCKECGHYGLSYSDWDSIISDVEGNYLPLCKATTVQCSKCKPGPCDCRWE